MHVVIGGFMQKVPPWMTERATTWH